MNSWFLAHTNDVPRCGFLVADVSCRERTSAAHQPEREVNRSVSSVADGWLRHRRLGGHSTMAHPDSLAKNASRSEEVLRAPIGAG
jgi:hypothetical protein